MNGNKIESLDPLSKSVELRELYLLDNNIKDISALKNLTSLDILSISDNKIRSFRTSRSSICSAKINRIYKLVLVVGNASFLGRIGISAFHTCYCRDSLCLEKMKRYRVSVGFLTLAHNWRIGAIELQLNEKQNNE